MGKGSGTNYRINDMTNYNLSIIIPVFNNANFTKTALTDLIRLKTVCEIIIIDNGSTDNTEDFICELTQRSNKIRYVRNKENLGFAKACNIGYYKSISPNVLFLNNDIKVKENHENWVELLLPYCDEYIVGPTGGLLDKNCNFIKETNKIEDGVFYMSGWCLAGSKKIFNRLIINDYLGPFSEEFGKAYFEDTDLSLRATQAQIPFKIQDVPVHHFGKITSKKVGLSLLYPHAQKIFKEKWLGKL